MAQTGNAANVNAGAAYASSFGNLPSQTLYKSVDMESFGSKENHYSTDAVPDLKNAFDIGFKALNTSAGGAGTAGFGMIPIYVDPVIVDRTRKWTPLVELFPRRSNMGMTADYNVVTAKGGAFVAGEDAPLSETTTTYDRVSVGMKFLYSVGRVTAGPFGDSSTPNAMQQEVLVKTREIRELEESLIVNGLVSSDANEFDGFIGLQGSTNQVDKSSTALSLDDITTAIQYAFDDGGRPNLGVCGSAVFGDILDLLTSKIGYLQSAQQVFWGFSAIVLNTMVGQIPIVPSMYMTNTSNAKQLFFLDMSVIEMRVLQDLTYEKLAKTNDSEKFMLKIYEALINRAPSFSAFIDNIN
jgi:HK97 family phage major capsid protein